MKLDHVTVLVSSLERSLPYYDAPLPLLAFRKAKEHVWSDGNGFFLQFLQAHAGTQPYERYAAGMNHLGFGVDSADEIHAIRQAMRDAGDTVPGVPQLRGATALFLRDPDGIRFEITHSPPGVAVVD
jgi:lactoylglutathione lyase